MTSGVLLIGGPTASGKSALALELARAFDAEIVGADSRQIYRDMPVGTAAPSESDRAIVPHHLVAFLEADERYSAARFVADALAAIASIHARGKRAIVVGGTGFYLRALAGDVVLAPAHDPALRDRLARETRLHDVRTLHEWLASIDPARAAAIAPGDSYRVTRALEVALARRDGALDAAGSPNDSLSTRGIAHRKIALAVDDALLEARIAARVDAMLAAGFVNEAERVGPDAVAADAVGYPHALAYLAGWMTEDELRAALVRATRRYAKRQRTWFRHEPRLEIVEALHAPGRLREVARELPGWE